MARKYSGNIASSLFQLQLDGLFLLFTSFALCLPFCQLWHRRKFGIDSVSFGEQGFIILRKLFELLFQLFFGFKKLASFLARTFSFCTAMFGNFVPKFSSNLSGVKVINRPVKYLY